MLHTRLCEVLAITHPLLNAPMAGAAGAELAAAVSEAGGFGMLGGSTAGPDWLRAEIRKTRTLTDRPFGVGFISSDPAVLALLEVALEERVAAVSHSFADPRPYMAAARRAGVTVLNQVRTVTEALVAVEAGVDVIVAQGTEAGGHTGYCGTLPLVPAVVDVAQGIPVVAAGGIGDGRGLAAVLLLGAEGAWLGTRFVASREALTAAWAKERVVQATADETVLTRVFDLASLAPFPSDVAFRVLRNAFTDAWHGREDEVLARRAELEAQLAGAYQRGDPSIVAVGAGHAASLVHGLEPTAEIVQRLMVEAEQILRERSRVLLR
jgi:nitronate monooxygenase